MGTVLVAKILDDASTVLQDRARNRWATGELVNWLNEALVAIVGYKPSIYTLNEPFKLSIGTRQTIPQNGIQFMDVVRNLGMNGERPGRAVRIIDRDLLDTQVPDWHSRKPAPEMKHYTFNENDPKHFYVYPPANGTSYVELVYAAAPPAVTLSNAIPVDDVYEPALLNYVLYRAKLKETEAGADPVQAGSYLNACVGIITGRAQAEMAKNPNKEPNATATSRAPRI